MTKDYLDKTLDRSFAEADYRIDEKIENLKYEIKEQLRDQLSTFMTRIDPILIEVENSRIDRELTTAGIEKLKISAKDHEKRIKKLENL